MCRFFYSSILISQLISCSAPIVQNHSRNEIAFQDSISKADSIEILHHMEDYGLNTIDTFAVGDVNGDGAKDTAFILPLKYFLHRGNIDSEYTNISFTCNLPPIKHYDGFQGFIANVGDLDGNKTDELIYYPFWYQSNWAGIYVYGFQNNQWKQLGKGSIRRDLIEESEDPIAFLKSRIKKLNNTSFEFTDHIWRETDIVDTVRIVHH